MCVLVTKKDEHEKSVRAKSRIMVLGNKDPHQWTKNDCLAPIAPHSSVRLLFSLAIENNKFALQGDCKNAFCNPVLSGDEVFIVRPLKDAHYPNLIRSGDSAKHFMDYVDHPHIGMKCSDP
jgi:hypothetical protein